MTHAVVGNLCLLWVSLSVVCFATADLYPERYSWLGWVWFVTVQLVMLFFTVSGWFLLLPFCIAGAWGTSPKLSIKDHRPIDRWGWLPLNWVYGNPEDGVSGQQAIIYLNGSASAYMPHASPWWRAYCWSALRNSCDNLKYVFSWRNGPKTTLLGHRVGWWEENGYKVPIL